MDLHLSNLQLLNYIYNQTRHQKQDSEPNRSLSRSPHNGQNLNYNEYNPPEIDAVQVDT